MTHTPTTTQRAWNDERSMGDAPIYFAAEAASAWADGWNAGIAASQVPCLTGIFAGPGHQSFHECEVRGFPGHTEHRSYMGHEWEDRHLVDGKTHTVTRHRPDKQEITYRYAFSGAFDEDPR